ncbi:MAG: hypothetical protein KatS3mg002_1148 [Candidatus Woesearchaeota archaeon]|nr:MAG: hypothetical protein KatS3mg002_1148 [Candidatus Woesearchaeota archaeon]
MANVNLFVILYAFFTWIILAIIASINGWLRNKFYKKTLGELTAHQLSTIIFLGIIFFVTYFFVKWVKITNIFESWIVGFFWLILTIVFEFLFGHYVWKHPWGKLLEDYNILKGRIWILVLLALLFAPYLIYSILNI